MKNNANLQALPSKVILSTKNVVQLDELNEKERLEVQSYICKNISNQISNYYSYKKDEWKNFISIMK